MSDSKKSPIAQQASNAHDQYRLGLIAGIPDDELQKISLAFRDARVVVLPVAEKGIAKTPFGVAVLECWDVCARVTYKTPLNEGKYWEDKYADLNIDDIKPAIFESASTGEVK